MKQKAESRSAALQILQKTSRGDTMDRALDESLDGLAPRDRRLAHEIAAGVLRHRRTLDLALEQGLSRPDQPLRRPLRDVLRIGIYQLHFLDRVPTYAAVTSTVDLARAVAGERAAKLVNAVLRAVSRSRSFDASKCSLAERHSHPDWLVERWTRQFGTTRTEQLLAHDNCVPAITVQPLRRTQAELDRSFTEANVSFEVHPTGKGLQVFNCDVKELPGYEDGAFIVQDAAQRLLLEYAAVPIGDSIWDVCAAPGGKAVALAQHHQVVASDISRERMKRLRDNTGRTAADVRMIQADACTSPVRASSFDAVLVDAPCSATGTLARHPDARWSLSPKKIRNASMRQAVILDQVADAVRPGGLLVYLTCSLEKEENEDQVERFLETHSGFVRADDDRNIFPTEHHTDGGFGARMRRVT